MAEKTLILVHTFDGKFDDVYEHVSNLKKFGEIHPYMSQVNVITEAPDISCILYHIKETVTLMGILKINPEYEAEVRSIKSKKKVSYFSIIKYPFASITLKINFDFLENNSNEPLLVKEQIILRGNALLIAYFASILEKAHLKTFDNLKKKLKTNK